MVKKTGKIDTFLESVDRINLLLSRQLCQQCLVDEVFFSSDLLFNQHTMGSDAGGSADIRTRAHPKPGLASDAGGSDAGVRGRRGQCRLPDAGVSADKTPGSVPTIGHELIQ